MILQKLKDITEKDIPEVNVKVTNIIGNVTSILDEFHDEAQEQIRFSYELKKHATDKLDAVTDIVKILDKYTNNKTINIEKDLSAILSDIQNEYTALNSQEDTDRNKVKKKLFEDILQVVRVKHKI